MRSYEGACSFRGFVFAAPHHRRGAVVKKPTANSPLRIGEYGWGGAASTHFWISPKDELAVVVLSQRMPFTSQLEDAIKPLVYDAIVK